MSRPGHPSIGSLPPAILLLIFTHTSDSQFALLPTPSPNRSPSPLSPLLAILGTCRAWRTIALAKPELWQEAPLFLTPWAPNLTEKVGLWAKHSKSREEASTKAGIVREVVLQSDGWFRDDFPPSGVGELLAWDEVRTLRIEGCHVGAQMEQLGLQQQLQLAQAGEGRGLPVLRALEVLELRRCHSGLERLLQLLSPNRYTDDDENPNPDLQGGDEDASPPPPPTVHTATNTRLHTITTSAATLSFKTIAQTFSALVSLTIRSCKDLDHLLLALAASKDTLETVVVTLYMSALKGDWVRPSLGEGEQAHEGRRILLPRLTHLELRGLWVTLLLEAIQVLSEKLTILRLTGREEDAGWASPWYTPADKVVVSEPEPTHLPGPEHTLGSVLEELFLTESHANPRLEGGPESEPQELALKELSVKHFYVPPTTLVRLLRRSPKLEHLQMAGKRVRGASAVVDALASWSLCAVNDGMGGRVCPALKHLNLSGARGLCAGPLVRLVRSRLPGHGTSDGMTTESERVAPTLRIETLIIDECDAVDALWVPWLEKHVPKMSCVFSPIRAKGVNKSQAEKKVGKVRENNTCYAPGMVRYRRGIRNYVGQMNATSGKNQIAQ